MSPTDGFTHQRVVLVDDAEGVRERLQVLLESAGFSIVGHASDAKTALDVVESVRPDCVVLDLGLAKSSGFDVLRQLALADFRPRVVVLTNYDDAAYRERAMALGADVFLDKSSQFDSVAEALRPPRPAPAALSRNALGRVLGSVSDAVLLLRPDFQVIYASHPSDHVLGWRQEDLVGRVALDLVHPDDQPLARRALARCLRAGGTLERVELRVRAGDDGWGVVEAVVVNRMDDPLIEALVVTLTDRTASHALAAALARTTHSLELALTASRTAIFEWDLRSNRFRMSGGWRTGMGDADLPDEDDFAAWAEFLHPDDRVRGLTAIEAARAGAESRVEMDLRVTQLDGRLRWLSIRGEIERDEAGAAVRMRGAANDITTLKEVEAQLRASEAVALELIEQAPAAMVLLEADGTILGANARAVDLMGRDRPHLLGRNIADTFVPEERDNVRRYLAKVAADGSLALDRELLRGDGTSIFVESSARRLPDGRIQSVMQDVTARRELEARQRQAQKLEALGQLTSGIAHDLNNLLTIIVSNSSFALANLGDQDPNRGLLESVRSAGWKGAAMIRRLTSFARSQPLALRPVAVRPLLADIVTSLGHILPAGIRLDLAVVDDLPEILADPVAVEQIVLNLATNARDAMPGGGVFGVQAQLTRGAPAWNGHHERAEGVFLRFRVTDTGVGMDPEVLSRVFEPFFSTKPRNQGTGLGMAMVYGLMKQHHGAVVVTSVPGRGTTVDLYFPVGPVAS